MEILQTIWIALTTENEWFTDIITTPLTLIEATVTMLLFLTVLNINSNKKQKLTYVAILFFLSTIFGFLIPKPFNTFINLLIAPALVFIIFKTNLLKSILSEIIPYIIFAVIGSIIHSILTSILKIPTIALTSIPIYKFICSLTIYILAFFIYKLLLKYKINIYEVGIMSKKTRNIFIVSFIIGTISVAIQSYIFSVYTDSLPFLISLFSICITIIYFFFNIFSLSRSNKLEKTTQNLEEEKMYNKTLTILYDNIRGFKHDFNNIVQAIGGYISSNNLDDLKEYYNGLLEDCQKANNLSVLNPELINNPAIYSLLTSKYHKAEEISIKMNIEVILDLSTIKIKPYELSRILGILLDNSIEAAKDSKEKIVNVIFRKDSKVNRDLIIIENSYLNKNVDTDRIFEKGYTSKTYDSKNHGLGLWEVRQILNKSNNLNLHTNKTNELFKQQLEIY